MAKFHKKLWQISHSWEVKSLHQPNAANVLFNEDVILWETSQVSPQHGSTTGENE